MKFIALSLVSVLLAGNLSRADVKIAGIFGDHMVLQGGVKIPVWGKADAAEKVTVSIGKQHQSAIADESGKWRVMLDGIESSMPLEMTVKGKNAITIKDILIGEVWLCSGQSNMTFELHKSANAAEAIKAADHPAMRLFVVGRAYPNQLADDVTGKWEVCSPESAKNFSAVGYFFGVDLQKDLKKPIGLVESGWGGTRAEAWLRHDVFEGLKLPYEPKWTEYWADPKNKGTTEPWKEAPAVLYNGMIAPIVGFPIRGCLWYQGETNTAYGEQYHDVLTALVNSWRKAWDQGDFPFIIVQLANLDNKRFWPTLREGQSQVAREIKNGGLVVTIDLGESKEIHYKNKQTVGQRAALVARKVAYKEDVVCEGPTFRSMKVNDGSTVIEFDHGDGGLVAKGDKVEGFEVADVDGKFIPATAKIDGETIVVRAEGVARPASVRYAYENDPKCNLYNRVGLPAVPFQEHLNFPAAPAGKGQ